MTTAALVRNLALFAAVWIGLGTLLAFWAPYGSTALGWPGRWIYWMGMSGAGWSAGLAVEALARRFLPRWPRWTPYALAALAASLAVTAATIGFYAARGAEFSAVRYLNTALQVGVLVAAVTSVYALVRERRGASSPSATEAVAGSALTDRLPPGLRQADILALSAEDHYLRVHTSAGAALIRMRLRDALLAVDALDGARIHRSWWVARAAVRDIRPEGGKAELTLTTGAVAPVSRTYWPALKEAGWG